MSMEKLAIRKFLVLRKEKKMNEVEKILESLGKCNCYNIEENIYRFNYYDEVLADISQIIDIDFSLKNRTLKDIKKIFSYVKK